MFRRYFILLSLAASGIKCRDDNTPGKFLSTEDVTYYLYTRENPIEPTVIKNGSIFDLLSSPHFEKTRKNLFVIHGWLNGHRSPFSELIKNASLKRNDLNVFVVDWSSVTLTFFYFIPVGLLKRIGDFIGEYINEMMTNYDIGGGQFILIGHSLGAHVAGNAGSATKEPLYHIIGLDPAHPLLRYVATSYRLDQTDARYVQVVHSSSRFLGFPAAIGHIDFFPNGGRRQPGCGWCFGNNCLPDILWMCSHSRAYDYFAEALTSSENQFVAVKCGSYKLYKQRKCEMNSTALMGQIEYDEGMKGKFYLDTNANKPFGTGVLYPTGT